MEKRSPAMIKMSGFQRYIVWNYLQPLVHNIRVSEFPKSGGTWLCQMLASLLAKDFPRNRALPMKSCIQHSHYPGPVNSKTIVLIRDGRDVMTSAYFHFLIHAPSRPRWLINKWRAMMGECDFENVKKAMPRFIEVFSTKFTIAGRVVSWSDHVLSFDFNGQDCLCVHYEDLLIQPKNELNRITQWLSMELKEDINEVVEKYSFQNQSKRKPGEEDRIQFLRKGIAGDWKNYFTREAIEAFNKYHFNALKKMGYD